ncbi:MAG: signal peptidase II [Fibromonadaceae bacterium]|jgi:signal peptidase II|nr:signal peptidase II [Fibromonadaceae bacterium]
MKTYIYAIIAIVALILDQATKFWADSHNLGWSMPIIGDFLRFTLVYNENAAFSMKPQSIPQSFLPWLSPTVFFGTLVVLACIAAIWFFRGLHKDDYLSKLGIALIIAGAWGNFCDRLRIGKVVDFIDVIFIDFIYERWPTFNLADSWVTIGISLLFISSLKFSPHSADRYIKRSVQHGCKYRSKRIGRQKLRFGLKYG